MALRTTKYFAFLSLFICTASFSRAAFAQQPTFPAQAKGQHAGDAPAIDMDVYVKGADGGPIEVSAVVTLISRTGQVLSQGTTLGGNIEFREIPAAEYTIRVVAPGYENAVKEIDGYSAILSTIIVDMRRASNRKSGAGLSQMVLAPKIQKELGKASEALRVNKLEQARSHLEAAYRKVPNHPAVTYLFGVYFQQMQDPEKAITFWTKTLEFDPNHVLALLSLSEALVREARLNDAEMYVRRAVEADPSSWRAHAIRANVLLKEGLTEDAIKEANHALELGHGQANGIQPLLARALAESGNKERAVSILGEYVQDHPNDAPARKQLESLQTTALDPDKDAAASETDSTTAAESAIALPLPSNWLPPDVDENVPPVDPNTACSLDEVVQKAGQRVEEFVTNVDRFAATEFLKHESINKWGLAAFPETRKFNYVVTIKEYRPGYFDVLEYRENKDSSSEFPGGIETRGLPAMALIFHPSNAGHFAMSCEGLGQWNGLPTWEVHFRQKPDQPNTTRAYQIGENGPSYPVALRGRAWVAADSYQIVRMETDLISTLPQIRLFADHTIVEYGPVRFKSRNVEIWLPQSAEMYSDWRGRRMHRRDSFSNYVLFSVDEKETISQPKTRTKTKTQN